MGGGLVRLTVVLAAARTSRAWDIGAICADVNYSSTLAVDFLRGKILRIAEPDWVGVRSSDGEGYVPPSQARSLATIVHAGTVREPRKRRSQGTHVARRRAPDGLDRLRPPNP